MKKVLVAICLFFFLLHNDSFAMSDTADLGLTLASATMDAKNITNGLKNVAKDKTTEWMWDSVGGLEKMILQNNEAQIKDATNKLLDIVNIVQSINKISISIANGKYDDAAIEAVDQVVGKVNHPLVSATWSAVKLSYESHKLVVSTESERQVEILYNIVNHDRMLLGVSDPKNPSPPQIPINKKTADYFFNKYIMTNDRARNALKAYVTTVLGQEWPEQSWSEWLGSFRTIGMGIDTKKNAELEMLDREWRNKGRSWVIAVIKDINKQAKQSWAELKVRQEMVKFKRFARSVELFKDNDLTQMLKDFREIESYKKELPLYKEEAIKSVKLRAKISTKISSLNAQSFKKYNNSYGNKQRLISYLRDMSYRWQSKMMVYGSRASLLRKKSLSKQCYSEMNKWLELKDSISSFIISTGDSAVDKLANEYLNVKYKITSGAPKAADAMRRRIESRKINATRYIRDYSKYLKPFVWDFKVSQVGSLYIPKGIELPSEPKEFTSKLLKILNKGDVKTGSHMYIAWKMAAKSAFNSHTYYMKRASMGYFELEPPKDLPKSCITAEDFGKKEGWNNVAKVALIDSMTARYMVEKEKFDLKVSSVSQLVSSFEKLRNLRKKQYDLYNSKMKQIFKYKLYYDYSSYKKAFKKYSNELYNGFGRLDKGIGKGDLWSLPWILNQKARQISRRNTNVSYMITSRDTLKEKIDNIKKDIDDFNKLPKLSQKDIQEIEVFTKKKFDYKKLTKKINEIDRNLNNLKKVVYILDKWIKLSQTDELNRARDSFWLQQIAKDISSFIDFIQKSGKIKRDSTGTFLPHMGLGVVLPSGIKIKNGMLISYNMPTHYLTESEINSITTPLKLLFRNSNIYTFLHSYFPKVAQGLDEFLSLSFIKPAKENIIINNRVVYQSDIKNTKDMLSKINIKDDNFDTKMQNLPKCFPSIKDFRKFYYNDSSVDLVALKKSAIGVVYLKQRAKIKKLLDERRAFLIRKEQEANRIKSEAQAKELEKEAVRKSMIQGEKDNLKIANIRKLYEKFAEYYSYKDLSSLLSLVSDDWSCSSDSTSIDDLEAHLERTFKVFDEIQYNISNLEIQPLSKSKYKVSYNVNIIGEIYDDDIEHIEKSSVQEEVEIKKGKVIILKTLGGQYWSVK